MIENHPIPDPAAAKPCNDAAGRGHCPRTWIFGLNKVFRRLLSTSFLKTYDVPPKTSVL